MPLFRACFTAGVTYLDMAMSLSHPHPSEPYAKTGVMLGDEQFAMHDQWKEKGLLALCGIGIEPGLSDVFARYAADKLFSSIDELGVRDGANLVVEGYDFAPSFSIWTTIEECLNPPVIWERDKGWFTTPPFSEPETSLSRKASDPSSVSTSSTRRCCSCRAGWRRTGSRLSTAWATNSSRSSRPCTNWVWIRRPRSAWATSRSRRVTWSPAACPTRPSWATGCRGSRAPGPG
jgi:hypothetical protein